MNRYEFTVTIADPPEGLADGERFLDFSERVYGAFGGDVDVQMSRGAVFVVVEREATSMGDAIGFALNALGKIGLRAARFGPEELVTAAEIASRLNISRERINQLAQEGALPLPVAALAKRSPMYRWVNVVERLGAGRLEQGAKDSARLVERVNAALILFDGDVSRIVKAVSERQQDTARR